MSISVGYTNTAFQKQRFCHQMYIGKGSYTDPLERASLSHSIYNFTSNERKRPYFPHITFEELKTMDSVQNNNQAYCNMPLWKAIIQYYFNQSPYFHRRVKFNKLIVQQLSPDCITSFLKVYKNWCIVPLYVHYFSSNWQTSKILFDLWHHSSWCTRQCYLQVQLSLRDVCYLKLQMLLFFYLYSFHF
jgi:hypothetical protein